MWIELGIIQYSHCVGSQGFVSLPSHLWPKSFSSVFLWQVFLQYWNIPIMPFCSNLMFGHLCFGHCFLMAWDEIVFLQPSHFVRPKLFG